MYTHSLLTVTKYNNRNIINKQDFFILKNYLIKADFRLGLRRKQNIFQNKKYSILLIILEECSIVFAFEYHKFVLLFISRVTV